jgi:type IV secretion system protein VirB10
MAPRATLHGGGRLLVPAGTVIEGQLHTTLRSDLPGHAVGTVTQSVYDASQRVVVIPRQSWLLGTYDSDVVNGQARLAVQWTVIRFPDGRSYDLPAIRASDRSGASGLAGRVDRHHRAVFGQALLSSLIAAGSQFGVPDAEEDGERSPAADAAAITAQQLGQTAAEVTRRNLGLKPTIVVPRLTRFTILLDRDLVFLPRTSR